MARIAQTNYYDPLKETRVKCDASHSGLGATLEQSINGDDWVTSAFASRYLNAQENKYSTNELELLAVVWSVDRFKHYLLGKEFTLATDHKALTSALGEHKSNKTYQSRLTRWVDRLLPYQFKVVHIPGKDMEIVDYFSRDPIGGGGGDRGLSQNWTRLGVGGNRGLSQNWTNILWSHRLINFMKRLTV